MAEPIVWADALATLTSFRKSNSNPFNVFDDLAD
jgi:hypothetical protein